MKSTDLMIGDWIYDIILKSNIKVDKLKYEEIEGDSNVEFHDEDTFKPIPLTPEILEKNNIIRKALNELDFDILFNDYNEPSLAKRVDDSEHGYHDFEYICDVIHVHTLQHILKLLSIEKEIVL